MTQTSNWMIIVMVYNVFFVMMFDLVQGVFVHTQFERVSGTGAAKIKCAKDAGERSSVATKIDGSSMCTSLTWDWASSPSYESDSAYFVKNHVGEEYDTPMVLDGKSIRLPVTFSEKAHIDMQIEFTRDDFSYGYIKLSDRLPGGTGDETIMILMETRPQVDNVYVKSYAYGWANQGAITPYPFPAGSKHRITFKAYALDLEILIDNVHVMMCRGFAPPEDARKLEFSNTGMLLHRIEFVGP